MIPCPGCGTRNRRGSKYCYSCGQPLGIVFNVSCPACDRLNPGGSAFCAFCGAKIASPAPTEEPLIAERPAQTVHEPLQSEPKSRQPPARPQRELPPWLYEQPAQPPEAEALPSQVSSGAVAEPPLEQSKYLSDIPGALPKTEGWLSSVHRPAVKPDENRVSQSKPKGLAGCLTLVLAVLLAVVGLVLMIGM